MSRRKKSIRIGNDGTVEVRLLGIETDEEMRPQFQVTIRDASNRVIHQSDDLRLGAHARPDAAKALQSALSFLEASAEAYDTWMRTGNYSENYGLFNDEANEYAYLNRDELAMAVLELDEEIALGRGLDL